jgi:glutamyl-tRNA reductase
MKLFVVGSSHRTAPVELRERLALDGERLVGALEDLVARHGCEAVILSTCNRLEIYVALDGAMAKLDAALLGGFLAEYQNLSAAQLAPHLYNLGEQEAVHHLFRVAASLDSMIVGESQIVGQVKRAYELAHEHGTVGPVLHALFQSALLVAKRVRSETAIAAGHVSVSSAAVEYVRQVFDRFDDKSILVIGAGKMGELTLRQLRALCPKRIWVANRSPEKAVAVAAGCGGMALPWEELDKALVRADIVLSTTGAQQPIISLERYEVIRAQRCRGTVVILDIAVPRDFDPRIHDGDQTCLFNIDDLKRIREHTLSDRLKQVGPAEAIVAEEVGHFLKEWARRQHAPVIARLTQDFEAKKQAVVSQLFRRLNGKLDESDCAYIDGAFRHLQNQFLHGPISALAEESPEGGKHTLLDALRKLFRLHD